ncbi:MAG: hypothetical protein GEU96_19110 [Propionibacteriales bacterium]|nr:hypothetical protein [Propionibacteriales bacterium]
MDSLLDKANVPRPELPRVDDLVPPAPDGTASPILDRDATPQTIRADRRSGDRPESAHLAASASLVGLREGNTPSAPAQVARPASPLQSSSAADGTDGQMPASPSGSADAAASGSSIGAPLGAVESQLIAYTTVVSGLPGPQADVTPAGYMARPGFAPD